MKVRYTPPSHDGTNLTVDRHYEVLGIEGGWLRLMNDRREPVLVDPASVHVVDPTEPSCWESRIEDRERFAYPPGWGKPGFFEDWHDGVGAVRREFWDGVCRWFPSIAQQS